MDRYALHVEAEAASLDEAVDQALARLDCTRAEVDVEILQLHSSGFLGLFARRPARVAVRIADRGYLARQYARGLLALSGLGASVTVSVSSQQIDLLLHAEQSSLIIGRHGQTLDALQSLVNTMTDRQTTDRSAIVLDIDGYRQRRYTFLCDLAKRLIGQLRKSGQSVTSPPLSTGERRILHGLLKVEPDLETCSQQQRGGRKTVVLSPRGCA